jgi:hypothetical protein
MTPMQNALTTTLTSCKVMFCVFISESPVKINNIITEKMVVIIGMFIFCNKYEIPSINKQGF